MDYSQNKIPADFRQYRPSLWGIKTDAKLRNLYQHAKQNILTITILTVSKYSNACNSNIYSHMLNILKHMLYNMFHILIGTISGVN